MDDQNGKISAVVVSAEKPRGKNRFWHINREMLPYKIHFVLFVGGAGLAFPFQSAFGITVLGFTAGNIAACYTALQITILLLKPAIGYIADYTNRLKVVMIILALLQVTFSFFMIIIPNTGMPGMQKEEVIHIFQNETHCQLCLNPKVTEQFFAPKRYLDENTYNEISSCFNNNRTQSILINCSTEYFKSINSAYDNYEIKQTTCKSPHTDAFLAENKTSVVNFNDNNDWLDILYIKNSSNSIVCLLPKEITFNLNITSDDLNEYCYDLSNEVNLELQKLFLESDFTTLYCNDLSKNNVSQRRDEQNIGVENFKTYQFWAFAICLVLSCTFGSSQFTMSDTVLYESIKGNDYGQQRVWGAISWGLMAPFAGYLNDYTENYMAAWCIYACFTALQIWNFSKMNLVKPDFSQNILKDMKSILSSIEFLYFTFGVLMNGVFTGIIWYYLTWFVVSIGGNKLIIGMVHTFQCFLGEVPAMYFSGWLIRKLGHFNLVSLAIISHGIRFFLYSYLHNPWWLLPIESLHGLTFGSFYAAMTSYAKLNAKPGTEATTQSILCTTYEAFGCGLGCLITGVCLEYYGGHTTFFYASFICVLATAINIFFTIMMKWRKHTHVVTASSKSAERY